MKKRPMHNIIQNLFSKSNVQMEQKMEEVIISFLI